MATVINADMKLFADRMGITTSRMIKEYGLKSIDEIIDTEIKKGNTQAARYSMDLYNSPQKLINAFRLTNVENKYRIIKAMDPTTRNRIMPLLTQKDLVMGLYFYTQEKLLAMLQNVDIAELVRVAVGAFTLPGVVNNFQEKDLMAFFQNKNVEKIDVIMQIQCLPQDVMQKFIEETTGKPAGETDIGEIINQLVELPDDQFQDFMSLVDPEIQKNLVFQMSKEKPEYLQLFSNVAYTNMFEKLMKQELVEPMINLNKDTLMLMMTDLPTDLLSIVCAQVDTKYFAEYILSGHHDALDAALMI